MPTIREEGSAPEPSGVFLELDTRRRVSLGGLAAPEHTQYLGHREPDGTIILIPATVIPLAELPASVTERVDAFLANPGSGTIRTRHGGRPGVLEETL